MPTPCPHPVRPLHHRLATPHRPRLRPWAALSATAQLQLAQQVARVLQRVRIGEARRVDDPG
jgi:hypothetical protein